MHVIIGSVCLEENGATAFMRSLPGGAMVLRGDRGDQQNCLLTLVPVIHPAAQAYVRAAAEATGAVAARRDKEKMDKHRASAEGGADGLVPLSVETYGRMGGQAMQLLRDLAELASEGGAVDEQRRVQRALRKLSVGLMRGNEWKVKAGLGVGARRAGRVLQAGPP